VMRVRTPANPVVSLDTKLKQESIVCLLLLLLVFLVFNTILIVVD
jgi:hypothetical protein